MINLLGSKLVGSNGFALISSADTCNAKRFMELLYRILEP